MGAGAGYNIKGTIDYDSIRINSYEIGEPYFTDGEDNVFKIKYQIIPIKCDIDCKAEDVSSEAYYDGGTLHGLTPIKIIEMSLIPYDDIEDISIIDEYTIRDALDNLKFDASIGGGWSHTTFDGNLYCEGNDLEENNYTRFYFKDINMYITDKYAIEILDEYATGDTWKARYSVVDIDGNILSDDFYGEEEFDAAIEYAKKNNGYQVESEKLWHEYGISESGDIYLYDSDYNHDWDTVEWENPDYVDEDF